VEVAASGCILSTLVYRHVSNVVIFGYVEMCLCSCCLLNYSLCWICVLKCGKCALIMPQVTIGQVDWACYYTRRCHFWCFL